MAEPLLPAYYPGPNYALDSGTSVTFNRTGVAGDWYAVEGNPSGSFTPAIDTEYAMPFFIPPNRTIDRLAINIAATAGAGGIIRLGIRSDNDVWPSTLVNEAAATIATDGTTGIKEVAATGPTAAAAGQWVWITAVAQVSTTGLSVIRSLPPTPRHVASTTSAGVGAGAVSHPYNSGVSGALGASFASRGNASNLLGQGYLVLVRLA